MLKGVSIVVKEKLEVIEPEVELSDCLKSEIQRFSVMEPTLSMNSTLI